MNPRLPSNKRSLSQIELLHYMEDHFNLLPLARSMSDNGYFDEEPVIIIPKEDEPGAFIVIEGNRRLAALKFLTDPELMARSAYKEQYEELARNAVENLTKIPAVKYNSRKETVAMLGFRHIAGISKWASFSKAEFVYNFIQDNEGLGFSEVARILGDRPESIRRNYATYSIFIQANNLDIDTSKLVQDFSVFYTALGRIAFQDFIGIKISECEIGKFDNPIPADHQKQLEEMITWVHGTEEVDAIISESRDLKKLAAVLKSKNALEHLRVGGKLNDAYSLTTNENQAIIDSINKASFNIEESLRFLHRHTHDPAVSSALLRCAQSLHQALNYFPGLLSELTRKSKRRVSHD